MVEITGIAIASPILVQSSLSLSFSKKCALNTPTSYPTYYRMANHYKPKRELLFGLIYLKRKPDRKWSVNFRWGRIAAAFGILALAGWLSCGAFLYFFFKIKRDFEDVSFAKMLILPLRDEEHKREMGNYHIEQAKKLMEEKEWQEAHNFLRAGVMRAPANIEGRLLLAEFYVMGFKQPNLGIEILKRGMPYVPDDNLDYIRTLVGLMLGQEQDLEMIDFAESELENRDPQNDFSRIIGLAAARSAFFRGKYDTAHEYIDRYSLDKDPSGLSLKAKILAAQDQIETAVALLESSISQFEQKDQLFIELIKLYREQEEFDKARRYALLRNLNNPLNPGPRVELLYAYDYSQRRDRLESEIEKFIEQFGSEPNALALLGQFGVDTGNAALNRRLYNRAINQGFDPSLFSFFLIESEVVAENYALALELIEDISAENPEWLEERTIIFSSLRAVAYFGAGRDANGSVYLQDVLQNPDIRVETLIALSTRLERLDRPDKARAVLQAAFDADSSNQAALTNLIRLDIELGQIDDLTQKVETLLEMRRPTKALIQSIYNKLGSDKFLFAQNRRAILNELDQILRQSS